MGVRACESAICCEWLFGNKNFFLYSYICLLCILFSKFCCDLVHVNFCIVFIFILVLVLMFGAFLLTSLIMFSCYSHLNGTPLRFH